MKRHNILRAVLYHRVSADPQASRRLAPSLVTVNPAALERQLRHIARVYHPVSAEELVAAVSGTHELPPGAVSVTFDDGYRDFRDVAWPLLKQYGVPAILFVPTAHVGGSAGAFWWDALWQILSLTSHREVRRPDGQCMRLGDERCASEAWAAFDAHLKRLSPSARRATVHRLGEQLDVQPRAEADHLTWDELRQLAQDGAAIAAHSRTHELLDQLDQASLHDEIRGSRDDLVRQLGTTPRVFAYPNGNSSDQVVAAVASAGFRAAFSVRRGASRLGHANPLLLRRDHGALGPLRLALALLGPVPTVRAHIKSRS